VPHADEPDFILSLPESFHESIDSVPGKPEDNLNAEVPENIKKYV